MKHWLDFLYCHSKNSNKKDPDKFISYAILKLYDIDVAVNFEQFLFHIDELLNRKRKHYHS
jgi:hypothetical protein